MAIKCCLIVDHFEWETCQTYSPLLSLQSGSFKYVLINLNIFTQTKHNEPVIRTLARKCVSIYFQLFKEFRISDQ